MLKKEPLKAKKLLEEVIKSGCETFSPIAHYYMVHLLIREKNPSTRTSCPELFRHGMSAKRGLEALVSTETRLSQAVSAITNNYRDTATTGFLVTNSYEAQKQDKVELYNLFLRSLDDIFGTELTPQVRITFSF